MPDLGALQTTSPRAGPGDWFVGGHRDLPAYGHPDCPLADMSSRWVVVVPAPSSKAERHPPALTRVIRHLG
jgi:hypothetical protein